MSCYRKVIVIPQIHLLVFSSSIPLHVITELRLSHVALMKLKLCCYKTGRYKPIGTCFRGEDNHCNFLIYFIFLLTFFAFRIINIWLFSSLDVLGENEISYTYSSRIFSERCFFNQHKYIHRDIHPIVKESICEHWQENVKNVYYE